MKRRNLLIGMGSFAAAGGAAVGTGAFSTAEATRDVSVQVANENNAFLSIKPSNTANGQFATQGSSDNQIGLGFSGSGNSGQGVGQNSVYNFDDVFRIANQGTQTVYVWSRLSGGSKFDDDNLYFYPNGARSTELKDNSNSVLALSPGESAKIGVHVDTGGLSTGSDTITATIRADVNKPGNSESVGSTGDQALVVSQDDDVGDFSSIQAAIGAADGTTILVQPGTYREEVTVDKSVTIRAANGQPTVESPDGNGNTFNVSADGVIIEGLEIKNSVGSNSGFSFSQCITTNGALSDLTIQNNVFRDVGSGSGARGNAEPISIQPKEGDVVENVSIRGNTFENIRGRFNPDVGFPNRTPKAIYVSTNPSGSDTAGDSGTARNIEIRGNTMRDIAGPVSAHGIQLHYRVQNVQIIDNEIYDIRGDPQNNVTGFTFNGQQGGSLSYDFASAIQLSKGGGGIGGPLENILIKRNYLRADSSPADTSGLADDKLDDKATPGFALEVAGFAKPATITLRQNSLEAAGGIINKVGGGSTTADGTSFAGGNVDAKQNWWGDSSGPSSKSSDDKAPYASPANGLANGSGALVVDYDDDGTAEVNFSSFLRSPNSRATL